MGKILKIYNEEVIKYISLEGKEVTNTEIFTNNKIFAKKQDNFDYIIKNIVT